MRCVGVKYRLLALYCSLEDYKTMNYEALGNRIRKERQNAKLTQAKLAEKIDVSTSFIGQIERGERKFSIETLVGIADVLNVSVDYLLRDSFKMNKKPQLQELFSLFESLRVEDASLIVDMAKLVIDRLNKSK